MKFGFGGSLKKWWQGFEENVVRGGGSGGELGKLTTSVKQGVDNITDADYIGGTAKTQISGNTDFNRGLLNLDRNTIGWSRQLSPLWEGGMSGTGGTLHQDLYPWLERTGMKASHHLLGTGIPGYGSGADDGGGGGSKAVVAADTEDPSLINQGNFKNPDSITSLLRREEMINKAGLFHDRAKDQRGRLSAANLS